MIKLIYCFRRKPGMSREEFSRYWREVHGPIGARIPGLLRLVQCHRYGEGDSADFDGVAELTFQSLEALDAARQSPEWKRSGEDEINFLDPASAVGFMTTEHVIVDRMTS